MPQTAEIDGLVFFLQHRRDHRKAVQTFDERVDVRLPETGNKIQLLLRRDFLVAKKGSGESGLDRQSEERLGDGSRGAEGRPGALDRGGKIQTGEGYSRRLFA